MGGGVAEWWKATARHLGNPWVFGVALWRALGEQQHGPCN
jgi:hypothetical protein